MKKTLILALLTSAGLAACSDDAGMPVDARSIPHDPAAAGMNPSAESWGPIPPLDLSQFDFSTPSFSAAPGDGGTLSPADLSASMRAGQTVTEAKVATLPDAPPLGDVVFSLDLTGSMGPALNNVKTNAVNIMNQVAAVIPDAQFGVISYMDYPAVYSSPPVGGNCGYPTQSYGLAVRGDYPYRLDRSVTGDRANVAGAINALTLGNGADLPESYSRAFFETYSDANLAWRPGARRIVVNFGDAYPHDCDYNAIVGGGSDSGVDPGRDAVAGTADDLRILDVLDGMKANDVTLINLFNGPAALVSLWAAYAERTGGESIRTNTNGSIPSGADVASTIADLIVSQVRTADLVTLRACSADAAYAGWVRGVSPASYRDVPLPATGMEFDLTVGPPAGTAPGSYTFEVCVVGDGAEFGRQTVNITVLPDNHAPVAAAGADQEVPNRTDVTLDGSASNDPDGDALSYEWTDAAGAVVGDAAVVELTGLARGTHLFTLIVSDPEGLTDSDEVAVVVTNRAPSAVAGDDQEVPSLTDVTLDGSASSDPDGDALSYEWTDAEGAVVGDDAAVRLSGLAKGTHVFTVSVSDPVGLTDSDDVTVVVTNRAPSASAGDGATVEAGSAAGGEVTLDGSASTDADGEIVAYAWFQGSAALASGESPTVTLALGSHTLRLVVTDDDGATSEDRVVVRVVDTTDPTLALTASPGSLWPPNGKYHAIAVTVSASDLADAGVEVAGYVVSSEPDDANGNGDGSTIADIQVTRADGTVLASSAAQPRVAFRPGDRLEVRAERAGGGAGRVYRIVLTATDGSGNAVEATATVSVAHDQGKGE